MIDIVQARGEIVRVLVEGGFEPRDADGTDYANPEKPELRYKVGTSRGEVAVTIWKGSKQVGVLRSISASTHINTLEAIRIGVQR